MHPRLYGFLDKYNCIYLNQYGFRQNHSTTHALISLTEDIRNAIDNDQLACGVFIDLRKAFDTVDHAILLKKLEHCGVRGIPLEWFKSYLENRTQHVSINGYLSNDTPMHNGITKDLY